MGVANSGAFTAVLRAASTCLVPVAVVVAARWPIRYAISIFTQFPFLTCAAGASTAIIAAHFVGTGLHANALKDHIDLVVPLIVGSLSVNK
jgi:hypothetical protein